MDVIEREISKACCIICGRRFNCEYNEFENLGTVYQGCALRGAVVKDALLSIENAG